jgi:hypothetical protein
MLELAVRDMSAGGRMIVVFSLDWNSFPAYFAISVLRRCEHTDRCKRKKPPGLVGGFSKTWNLRLQRVLILNAGFSGIGGYFIGIGATSLVLDSSKIG